MKRAKPHNVAGRHIKNVQEAYLDMTEIQARESKKARAKKEKAGSEKKRTPSQQIVSEGDAGGLTKSSPQHIRHGKPIPREK